MISDSWSDTPPSLNVGRRQHYVGTDRRAAPPPDIDKGLGGLGFVSAVLVVLWSALQVSFLANATVPDVVDGAGVAALLEAAAAALGGVVTAVAFVRWRLIGETRVLCLGVAAFFVGPIAAGAGGLAPAVVAGPTPSAVTEILIPAATIVSIFAVVAAALVPEVDTRFNPRRTMLMATAAALALSGVLWTLPTVATWLAGPAGYAAIGVGWSLVAALHVRSAGQTGRRHHVAIAVTTSALAFGATTTAATVDAHGPIESAPYLFVVIALAVLLAQGFRDLEVAFCVQRERLLDSEVEVEAEHVRREAEDCAAGQRRHDARNALMAIQGAAFVLDRHRDRIDDDRREQLTRAMSGEVAHLQEIIDTDRQPSVFDLAAGIRAIVDHERAEGSLVRLEAAPCLGAVGRPIETAAVVRRLIRNARRHVPGQPVTVRAERDGDWTVVYVQDRGRHVDRSERQQMFSAEADRDTGDGLNLYVCRRLMLGQGGDLWVENRTGGGTSFAVCLPYDDITDHADASHRPRTNDSVANHSDTNHSDTNRSTRQEAATS